MTAASRRRRIRWRNRAETILLALGALCLALALLVIGPPTH